MWFLFFFFPQEILSKPVASSAPTPTIVRPGSLPLHLSNDGLHPTLPSPTSVITQAPPSNRQLRYNTADSSLCFSVSVYLEYLLNVVESNECLEKTFPPEGVAVASITCYNCLSSCLTFAFARLNWAQLEWHLSVSLRSLLKRLWNIKSICDFTGTERSIEIRSQAPFVLSHLSRLFNSVVIQICSSHL